MTSVHYEPIEAPEDMAERSGSNTVAAVAGSIASALDCLLVARDMANAAGEPVACVYIEGAAEALRTARDHLFPRFECPLRLEPGVLSLQGTDVALRRRPDGTLADRGRLEERDGGFVFAPDPLADEDGWPPEPDLGAALLVDAEVAAMCSRPWSSSLLADALSSHEWLHLASGVPSSLTRSAAGALVRAAGRGRGFPELAAGETQGLLDVRVAEVLKRLGWRRLRGPLVH